MLCCSCLAGYQFSVQIDAPRDSSAKQRKRSIAQEERIAAEIGGRRQRASGANAHYAGDVRLKGLVRVEAKYTAGKSYSVRREDLAKIWSECTGTETPAFQVTFLDQRNQPDEEWIMIPLHVWSRQFNGG